MKIKPNLNNIMSEYKFDCKILVPKNGGLQQLTNKTLDQLKVEETNAELLTYRAEDIPLVLDDVYKKDKKRYLGFTGDDLFDENQLRNPSSLLSVIETIDWVDKNALFGRPALCLITAEDNLKSDAIIAVNKKYEATARQYLKDTNQESLQMKIYSGNTEGVVRQGICDACIDIVYSGKSLMENNLQIKDVIRTSDFVLVGVDETNPRVLKQAYSNICGRVQNPVNNSYTSQLSGGWNNIIKKIGEEDAEFIKACITYSLNENESAKKEMIGEFEDRLYTSMIAMSMADISFDDIIRQEYRRL